MLKTKKLLPKDLAANQVVVAMREAAVNVLSANLNVLYVARDQGKKVWVALGATAGKVTVLRNGVDLALFHPQPREAAEVVGDGGDLGRTPVYLGCGDPDPHIPWARVDESAAAFTRQNAAVTLRRYPGFPHSVHPEAVSFARQLLETVGTS